ncbi:hypothetical protein [Corynebacterium macginleyi]|nr:hypothetical protein [Corynebacterium macginleyi]
MTVRCRDAHTISPQWLQRAHATLAQARDHDAYKDAADDKD